MASSKETVNKDKPSDSPVEICKTKAPKSLGKRKIINEILNPVKQVKIVREKEISPSNCFKCDKKLKFINAFKCRCNNFYCNKHRFNDQHDCSFDYKKDAVSKLKASNPKIASKKIGE